jgi:hypothetical protein
MDVADSVRLINGLLEKDQQKELCVMLAQTFLVQHWIKLSDNDNAQKVSEKKSI